MSLYRKNIGKIGEDYAFEFLVKNGHKILKRNFKTRYSEIDIISKKNNKLFFVEVKTRLSLEKGKPYEAVNYRKLRNINMAARYFLLQNDFKDYKLSIDVVSILLDSNMEILDLKHFENI